METNTKTEKQLTNVVYNICKLHELNVEEKEEVLWFIQYEHMNRYSKKPVTKADYKWIALNYKDITLLINQK